MPAQVSQRPIGVVAAEAAGGALAKRDVGLVTLHRFGPFLGTPDSSPFVIKTMLLLRLAGIGFRAVQGNPLKAPKKFLPVIEDNGVVVADSTFIRRHIEQKYGFDFDAGLSPQQKAVAWAVERMCEDHLYFAMLDLRWRDKPNFKQGLGRHMFGVVPAPLRPLAKAVLTRMNGKRLVGHGLGRHGKAEIAALALRDIDALAALLGDKPYLMGEEPCGADATVFGTLAAIIIPPLDGALVTAARSRANLVAYCDRIMRRHFAGAAGPRP